MSRKRKAPKKIPVIDPKYKSVIIPKLINSIMYDGKKVTAEKIVYEIKSDKLLDSIGNVILVGGVAIEVFDEIGTKTNDIYSDRAIVYSYVGLKKSASFCKNLKECSVLIR